MSAHAPYEFGIWYGALSEWEKNVARSILADWVDSPDLNKRFDALSVIRKHRIVQALTV